MAKLPATKERKKNIKAGDGIFNHTKHFTPLTENQGWAKIQYDKGFHLCMLGYAGTGKTYMALAFAIDELKANTKRKIHIFRSAVASRDIGFLPGTIQEKMSVYETPYVGIVNEIVGRGDAYQMMKQKDVLQFESTSFLRGITIDDAVVIVDEAQNLSQHEIDTLMTRLGENTTVIFCGDIQQTDLMLHESGLRHLINVLKYMDDDFEVINFDIEDIVRSGICRRWIIARERLKKAQ